MNCKKNRKEHLFRNAKMCIRDRKEYTELNRCVTRREYEKVLDYAFELGIENGFFQDGETARESFIPAFDYEGVRKMP